MRCSKGTQRGTQGTRKGVLKGALKGYSRGTQGVLEGYSKGYSRDTRFQAARERGSGGAADWTAPDGSTTTFMRCAAQRVAAEDATQAGCSALQSVAALYSTIYMSLDLYMYILCVCVCVCVCVCIHSYIYIYLSIYRSIYLSTCARAYPHECVDRYR